MKHAIPFQPFDLMYVWEHSFQEKCYVKVKHGKHNDL